MDRRTRELERAWRETGDVACGLEFVRALARSGEDERELLAVRLALGELRCLIGEVAALPAGRLLQPQIVRAVSDALERALLQAVAAAPAEPRRGRTPLPRAATLRRLTEILEATEELPPAMNCRRTSRKSAMWIAKATSLWG